MSSNSKDVGWYITLKISKKLQQSQLYLVELVYFPVYEPTKSVNKCSLGDAFICGVDDECGTNVLI